jgi:cell division transport system permease protein
MKPRSAWEPRAYAARHAQVLLGSLGRLAQNPIASLMTMAVIAVALALPVGLDLLLDNARSLAAQWNQSFDLSVYLHKNAGKGRAESLANQLRRRPDVAVVRVVTAADALAEFRQFSGFGAALDALGENPLPDTLVVTPSLAASTAEGTGALQAALAASSDVESVQIDTAWVRRLQAILELLRRIVSLAFVLLGAGVMLVIGNTIRLDVQNRRSEIEVMKLVGATDGFARRPFLYGGIWYGLGGGLLALVLVAAATAALGPPVAQLAAAYGSQFRLQGLSPRTGAVVLLAAGALGWLGAWLASMRHIRSIEPA